MGDYMAVYNIYGNQLATVYDIDGTLLPAAYDINGDEIISGGQKRIKVMTYNVQWFSKINSQQSMQNLIISKYNPNIIGFQEFTKTTTIPTVGQNMLIDYPYKQLSAHVNYMGIASKIAINDATSVDYTTQDTAAETERRAYQKCYIMVGGKRVAWFNTHLCYANSAPKYAQITELFNAAQQEEYFIITGDFNSVCLSASDADYIGMYKQFVDAGCNLANNSPTAGFTKTSTPNTTAASLADLTYTTDSIITSGNIDILSVVFDDTKLSYLDGNPIDHIPIIAEIEVN